MWSCDVPSSKTSYHVRCVEPGSLATISLVSVLPRAAVARLVQLLQKMTRKIGSEETRMHPEYLCHYTSVQALAQILDTKQLRLNRLDKVDDLQEAKSADLGNLGRFYFVSCWSESDEESLPLWSMCTPNMAGVRMRVRAKMFKQYRVPEQRMGAIHIPSECDSPLPLERMYTNLYSVSPLTCSFDGLLRKVEYTDDEAKLYPKILRRDVSKGKDIYGLGGFGIYKRLEWSFQKEWRYMMNILPTPVRYESLPESQWANEFERRVCSDIGSGSLPFQEFYLDIEPSAIDNIEVVLGPRSTKGDEVIVDLLLSKYCERASVRGSILKGSIR
jgi:hypothetical protein